MFGLTRESKKMGNKTEWKKRKLQLLDPLKLEQS